MRNQGEPPTLDALVRKVAASRIAHGRAGSEPELTSQRMTSAGALSSSPKAGVASDSSQPRESPLKMLMSRMQPTTTRSPCPKPPSLANASELQARAPTPRPSPRPTAAASNQAMSDDSDDEVCWGDHLEIVRESLDAPLPKAKPYGNIWRMRQTINQHADKAGRMHFLKEFRIATGQSLIRRFRDQEKHVVGRAPTVDIELGYK